MFGIKNGSYPVKSNVFPRIPNDKKTQFMRSVESLRPRDIQLSPYVISQKNKGNKRILLGALRYTILTASTLLFLGSSAALVMYVMNYLQSNAENEFLSNIFYGNTASYVTVDAGAKKNVETLSVDRSIAGEILDVDYNTGVYNEEFEAIRSKILDLKRQNPDVWGWIKVDGTNIDFPIMFSGDNEYYLKRSPTKTYNNNGSIFADGRTKAHLEDNRALVVYGHNMASTNSMFSELIEYTQENVFKNRLVTITTLDGIYTFEVFSVYNSSKDYNYIRTSFSSDHDFLKFVERCRSLSLFHKDMEFTKDDIMLTLSTCTVQRDDRRWAIHAKLIAVSK